MPLELPRELLLGKTTLDRSLCHASLSLLAVCIPAKETGKFLKLLHGYAPPSRSTDSLDRDLAELPRLRGVLSDPGDPAKRLLLLHERIQSEDLEGMRSMAGREEIQSRNLALVRHTVSVDYAYWSAAELFDAIIPTELGFASSFETIGHIAHLNLREELYPYKTLIGEILLEKNVGIRTVVMKTGLIETQFRTFPMEVLAGEEDFDAEVSENGCRFRFNFAKVYWNSRLHTEHERVLGLFKKNDIICDAFAGVGPFALPAAKKGCQVFANDLNPYSYEALKTNARLNKISEKTLRSFNLDGRLFLQQSFAHVQAAGYRLPHHFVMNLPATAIEFLDAFVGVLAKDGNATSYQQSEMPWIHCHCFSKSETPEEDVLRRTEAVLGYTFAETTVPHFVHYVRKVAPNKDMLCVSFQLPLEVALRDVTATGESLKRDGDGEDVCPETKRCREGEEHVCR